MVGSGEHPKQREGAVSGAARFLSELTPQDFCGCDISV